MGRDNHASPLNAAAPGRDACGCMVSSLPAPVLYVSDMDGTLLGTDSRVSDVSRRLISEAVAAGTLFTVATARTPATVSGLLEGIRLPVPAVVMTGSALWHQDTGLFSDPVFMRPDVVRHLLGVYVGMGLSAFIYTLRGGRLVIYHTGAMSDLERAFVAERSRSPYKRFEIPASGCSELSGCHDGVLLLYTMRPTAEVEPVYRAISGTAGCTPVYYHDIFGPEMAIMEVFAAGASKAAAIDTVRRRCGARSTVVFGDNVNDLPMMRAADMSVAVGNAIPEVLAEASAVIGPNSADSVARAIDRWRRG